MRNNREMTIDVVFQGNDYRIPGEKQAWMDYVDHSVECQTAKDAYRTYDSARRSLAQKSEDDRRIKRIYRCEHCGCFHFTTNDGFSHHRKHYDRVQYQRGLTMALATLSERDLEMEKQSHARAINLRRFLNSQDMNMTA